ncbi:MAG: HAMP domain-containing protein, partial [Gammaproteobacteria bacterium]|nr:HAMP domain-containing protein [Gammaproteobacteria bacterium]
MKLSIVSRVTLITIVLVILAGSTVSYVFYKNTAELLVERTLKDLAESIQVQGNVIRNHVLTQQKDGIFTANTPPIMGIYRAIHNSGFDKEGASTKEQWLERLQQIFTSILISDPDYYQIRYIGEDRKEIINVIKTDDGVKIIPQTLLQNKAHREYVKEGFKLEKGKTFLSEINLNKEHGKIVYPRKEILRTVVPIHNNDKKSPIGLIVLNTEIGHELKRMQQKMHASGREIYITNDGGGYLVHPDPELTYGFDLGKRYRVQEDFPLVSKLFVPGNTDKTIILLPEKTKTDELVVYTKVLLSPATGNHFIAVGLSQSYDDVISESLDTLKDTVMWAVLLALLTSLLAGLILTNSLRPLKRLATAMTNLSTGKDVDFHLPTFQQDEVGLLSRNFVQMAGEINKAKIELEKSNQQLEDRVE